MSLARSYGSVGRLILIILVLSSISLKTSGAGLIGDIRKLVEAAPGPTANPDKVSPSPSPNPSIVIKNNGSAPTGSDNEKEIGSLTDERCEATPYSCQLKNLTACVQFAEKVPVDASLLAQNGGEETLRVNASISPNNLNFTNILLYKSQARKIDITAILRDNQAITITSGNGSCVIHLGLSNPSGPPASGGGFFQKLPHADQVTPIHGAILFSVALLMIGGIWACCKSGTSGRQGEGIPYQELEMGQTNSISAIYVEEGNGGWDEVWDDNWDDDQGAIKPPPEVVDHHDSTVNNYPSMSSSKQGWDDDWEE